jgi:hypothetical protein
MSGRRRRAMNFYAQASTANPTGWRPWNSRLSYYERANFAVPTTGLSGPNLLPNYATFGGKRDWRMHPGSPAPIYRTPSALLSGLGFVPVTPGIRGIRFPTPYTGVTPRIVGQTSAPPVVSGGSGSGSLTTVTPAPINQAPVIYGGTGYGTVPPPPPGSNYMPAQPSFWQRFRRQAQPATPSAAGVITGYDASGAAIFSAPPAGAFVAGYDASGNPVYSQGSGGISVVAGSAQTSPASAQAISSAAPGSYYAGSTQASLQSSGAIVGYDAAGNALYSSPPPGLVVTSTDAYGNPIYGTAPAAGAAAAPSFFSEDSLGFGLNNGVYLAVGLGLVLILKKR